MRATVICLVVLLSGCSIGTDAPKDLMDREKFKEVLLEAQLIEARMNHELVIEHRSVIPMKQYYADLFMEQGVTQEQFEITFAYYRGKPDELKAIHEEVMTELSRRKDALDQ